MANVEKNFRVKFTKVFCALRVQLQKECVFEILEGRWYKLVDVFNFVNLISLVIFKIVIQVLGNELVGIVNWSARPCAHGFPDGYARISYHRDWFEKKMNLK